jgi:ABC-type amino acid transport substrate-binding protein
MKLALFLWICLCSSLVFANQPVVIRVGTSADFPPFSFIENGKYTGFDIELIEEIAKRLNYTAEITDMPFKTILSAIQLGRIDVIAAGLSETEERSKQVLFLPPHLTADPYVIVTKNVVLKQGIADLKGKTVVVNDGYVAATYMEQFKEIHLLYLKSPSDALVALETDRAFAFVTAKNPLNNFLKKNPKSKNYKLFIIKNTGESISLAVSKNNPELYEKLKKEVLILIQDGTVAKLKEKWGL